MLPYCSCSIAHCSAPEGISCRGQTACPPDTLELRHFLLPELHPPQADVVRICWAHMCWWLDSSQDCCEDTIRTFTPCLVSHSRQWREAAGGVVGHSRAGPACARVTSLPGLSFAISAASSTTCVPCHAKSQPSISSRGPRHRHRLLVNVCATSTYTIMQPCCHGSLFKSRSRSSAQTHASSLAQLEATLYQDLAAAQFVQQSCCVHRGIIGVPG